MVSITKLAIVVISSLLIAACSRGGSNSGAGAPYIVGSEVFTAKVEKALQLSGCSSFIREYTRGILETSTYSNAGWNRYTYLNTDDVNTWEQQWLVGVLCHESAHHYQMQWKLPITPGIPLACQRDFSTGYEDYLNSLGATTCPIQ